MKPFTTFLIAVFLCFFHLSSFAQVYSGIGYTGPKLVTTTSLIEQGATTIDENTLVRIQGTICPSDDNSTYYLQDENGQIYLTIEEEDWPYKPMDENTVFVVYGNIDQSSMGQMTLDVKKMFVLK